MRPRKILKISVRDRAPIACNLTCHSMPTLSIVHGDLCGSWRGRAPPLGIDFGTISRDFGRKILRPRKILKNCGPNRDKSATPQHADAQHCAWGPLWPVTRPRTSNRHGFRHDLARFRTKMRPRKNLKISVRDRAAIACNLTCHSMPTLSIVHGDLCGSWRGRAPPLGIDFGTISRDFGRKILRPRKILKNCGPNRDKSATPQHADAQHCAWGPLWPVTRPRTSNRHGFRHDLARFRTKNFAAAENVKNCVPNRDKIRHAAAL